MTALNGFNSMSGWAAAATANTILLDAAGDRAGGVYMAPKTGNIDRIACYCTAVAGTVPTYTLQLESVLAGFPNGIIASGRSGTFVPTATTLHVISLSQAYAVTVNELLAATLNAAGADGSNNATFNLRYSANPITNATGMYHNTNVQDLSVGTWSVTSAGLGMIVPVYDDGTYMLFAVPRVLTTTTDLNNTSTPDEVGIRWTQAGNRRSQGGVNYMRMLAAGSDWKAKLYDVALGDSAAPVREVTITASGYARGTSTESPFHFYWATPVDLVDGSDYRMTVVPTSTNNVRVMKATYGNADQRAACAHAIFTSRTRTADGDAGTWTDDSASSMVAMSALASQSNAGGASRIIELGPAL